MTYVLHIDFFFKFKRFLHGLDFTRGTIFVSFKCKMYYCRGNLKKSFSLCKCLLKPGKVEKNCRLRLIEL